MWKHRAIHEGNISHRMNSSCVSPASASTSGVVAIFSACQQITEGATKGTYSCVHRGSTSVQYEACISVRKQLYSDTNPPLTTTHPERPLVDQCGVPLQPSLTSRNQRPGTSRTRAGGQLRAVTLHGNGVTAGTLRDAEPWCLH